MPLAFSARCFTARHHRLKKDECDFRCRDDADGLLLAAGEGEPFLVLNGIQTQSAALQCLLTPARRWRRPAYAGCGCRRAAAASSRRWPPSTPCSTTAQPVGEGWNNCAAPVCRGPWSTASPASGPASWR